MAISAENIRDDIIGNLAGRGDITDEVIYRFIHYAQRRVSRLKAFDELNASEDINTTQGDRNYTFPGTLNSRRVRKIISIIPERNLDNIYEKQLIRVPSVKIWNKHLQGRAVVDEQSTPTHYLRWKTNELSVTPIPNATFILHIFYVLHPVEVTEANKSDELSLYSADDIILALTTSMLMAKIGRIKDAQHFFNVYRGSVRELVAEEGDVGDFDMAAIRVVQSSTGISDYWKDPFYNSSGSSEQV